MRRKNIIIFLSILLVSVIAAGCGSGDSDPPSPMKPTNTEAVNVAISTSDASPPTKAPEPQPINTLPPPPPIPTDTKIPEDIAPEPIRATGIDGYGEDWAGHEPFVVDAANDTLGDGTSDLVGLYYYEDNQNIYIMVESRDGFREMLQEDVSTLEIELGIDFFEEPACLQEHEVMILTSSRNEYSVYYVDSCENAWLDLEINTLTVVWGDVLEILIPKWVFDRFEVAGYDYIHPIHAVLDAFVEGEWTYEVDVVP